MKYLIMSKAPGPIISAYGGGLDLLGFPQIGHGLYSPDSFAWAKPENPSNEVNERNFYKVARPGGR